MPTTNVTYQHVTFLENFLDFLHANAVDGWELPSLADAQKYIRAQYVNESSINLDEYAWRNSLLTLAFLRHREYACHNTHFHTTFWSFYDCYTTTLTEVAELLRRTIREIHERSGA